MDYEIKAALESNFMLANLSTRQFPMTIGNKQQTEKVCNDTGASRKSTKVINNIWGDGLPDEIQAVHSELTAARATHERMTMPWMPSGERVKGTAGLLSVHKYTDYVTAIAAHEQQVSLLMDDVENNYSRICATARHWLGTMGGSVVHPPFCDIRARVAIICTYDTLKVGGDFDKVALPASVVATLKNNHVSQANMAMNLAVKAAWESALPPLKNLVTLCTKDRIHASIIGNLRQVVDSLGAFNITGDKKMDDVRQELAALCIRYPVEEIKKMKKEERRVVVQDAQQTLDKVEQALAALPW